VQFRAGAAHGRCISASSSKRPSSTRASPLRKSKLEMSTTRHSVPEDTRTVTASSTGGRSTPRAQAMKAAAHMTTLKAWHLAMALHLCDRVTPVSHLFSVTYMRTEGDSSSLSAFYWSFFGLRTLHLRRGRPETITKPIWSWWIPSISWLLPDG